MKKMKMFFTIAFILIPILAGGLSFADQKRGGKTYEVTITNLTRGQIFSPPIVMSHDENSVSSHWEILRITSFMRWRKMATRAP